MELLKLSMAMNKFYNNLQDREKKLLLGAIVLIFLFVVFIYVKGTYDKYNISKNNKILTNLGMYNEQKAQEYLIKALPEIQEYNVKLLLVGWGPRESILLQYIKNLNLQDNC